MVRSDADDDADDIVSPHWLTTKTSFVTYPPFVSGKTRMQRTACRETRSYSVQRPVTCFIVEAGSLISRPHGSKRWDYTEFSVLRSLEQESFWITCRPWYYDESADEYNKRKAHERAACTPGFGCFAFAKLFRGLDQEAHEFNLEVSLSTGFWLWSAPPVWDDEATENMQG